MPNYSDSKSIKRIIDANINRAKEGLRVCEEVARFILGSRKLTAAFKRQRHSIDGIANKLHPIYTNFINERDAETDSGRNIHTGELKREGLKDIFFANIQRVKESIRVLEEFAKLIDKREALKFKKIRYCVYGLEKETAGKLSSLRPS